MVSWTDTRIAVAVPSGATSGNVIVRRTGVDSNGHAFTLLTPPSIASVSPLAGTGGTLVTISGTNFGATQDGATVRFGNRQAVINSWSPTEIVATVPAKGNGKIVVRAGGVDSNATPFTILSTVADVVANRKQGPAAYEGNVIERPPRTPDASRALEV